MKFKKILLLIPVVALMLLSGCGQTKQDIIECYMVSDEDVANDFDMHATYTFSGDKLEKLEFYSQIAYHDCSIQVLHSLYNDASNPLGVDKEVKGVVYTTKKNDSKKTITQVVEFDFDKYDLEKDEYTLFTSRSYDKTTQKEIIDTFKKNGYTITKNGEKIQ